LFIKNYWKTNIDELFQPATGSTVSVNTGWSAGKALLNTINNYKISFREEGREVL
jgi:hypothetical protein